MLACLITPQQRPKSYTPSRHILALEFSEISASAQHTSGNEHRLLAIAACENSFYESET